MAKQANKQNTSYITKPHVISWRGGWVGGGANPLHLPPRSVIFLINKLYFLRTSVRKIVKLNMAKLMASYDAKGRLLTVAVPVIS